LVLLETCPMQSGEFLRSSRASPIHQVLVGARLSDQLPRWPMGASKHSPADPTRAGKSGREMLLECL